MYLGKYGGMDVGIFEWRHELGGGWSSEESAAPGFITNTHAVNINKYWKISAHAMGAAMPLGALVLNFDIYLVISSAIILFLVGFSRIYLKVHTVLQVFVGTLVGFVVSFALINYCK